MKSLLCLSAAFSGLILAGFLAATAQARSNWAQREFIIGTFWDPCLEGDRSGTLFGRDSLRFAMAKRAHFNLLTGFQNYEWIDHGPDGMAYACSVAAAVHLRYLVTDYRYLRNPTVPPFDPDTAAAVTDFYRRLDPQPRRALAGFFIGDEPHLAELPRVREWVSHFQQQDDSLLALINLLPAYSDSFPKRTDYESYLNDSLGEGDAPGDPDVACFDYYPFLADSIRTGYFYNLSVVKDRAGRRPMWVVIRSSEFPPYAELSPWHFRYSVFCPIAYGAKGLLYYTYEQNGGNAGNNFYGEAPVIDCDNYTWRYDYLQLINQYVMEVIGPVVMNSDHLGAFHSTDSWNGESIPAREQLTGDRGLPVLGIDDPDMLTGLFRDHSDTTIVRFLVVNKGTGPRAAEVTLQGNRVGSVWALPGLAYFRSGVAEARLDGSYDPNTDTTRISIHLMGGEGRLFRIAG